VSDTLFVTNYAPETTEDDLRALFGEYGDVVDISSGISDRTEQPYVVIEMASQKVATRALNALNGYAMGEYFLAVSYTEVDVTRDLTSKQRRVMDEILETLGETEKIPVRQIEAMVRLCGLSFVEAITREAVAVDAGEGMETSEGTRRTVGGIFFYLARHRMSPAVRRIVYNRKGKMPPEETA